MTREVIISLIVIIVILITNFFLQNYTEQSVEIISIKLDELKENMLNVKEDSIKENLEQVLNLWEDIQYKMSFFIEHDELEKLETDLVSLKGYIEVENYTLGIHELNKTIFMLEHIANKYDFSIINVL